jgi:hypothetical protein
MNRLIDFMAMVRVQSDSKYRDCLKWLLGQIEEGSVRQSRVIGSVRGV